MNNLNQGERALLNRLCDDHNMREQVFEHIIVGLQRGKVNGLYVSLPVHKLVDLFMALNGQLDKEPR